MMLYASMLEYRLDWRAGADNLYDLFFCVRAKHPGRNDGKINSCVPILGDALLAVGSLDLSPWEVTS